MRRNVQGRLIMSTANVLILTFLARAVFSLHQFGIIVIIARLSDADTLGIFILSLALVTTMSALFALGMRQGVATDIIRHRPQAIYFRLRLLSILASITIIPVIILIFWPIEGLIQISIALVFLKSIELMSEYTYGLMQLRRTLISVSASQIMRGVTGFLAFSGTFLKTESVHISVLAWGAAWLLIFLCHDVPVSRLREEVRTPENRLDVSAWSEVGSLAFLQMPFGLAAFSGNIGLAAPRVMLEHVGNVTEVGIFGAIWSIFQAGEAFVIALANIYLTPLAAATQGLNRRATLYLIWQLLVMGIVLGCVTAIVPTVIGAELLQLVYGPEFYSYSNIFMLLSLGWAVRYLATILRIFVTSQRRFWLGMTIDTAGSIYVLIGVFALQSYGNPMVTISVAFLFGQLCLMCTLIIFTWKSISRMI